MATMHALGLENIEKLSKNTKLLDRDITKIVKKSVDAGRGPLEAAYKGASAGLGGGGISGHTLTTPTKKNAWGQYAVSRPVGVRFGSGPVSPGGAMQIRYAQLAAMFNYGIPGHWVEYSKPNAYGLKRQYFMATRTHSFIPAAAAAAQGPVSAAVENTFNSLIKPYIN